MIQTKDLNKIINYHTAELNKQMKTVAMETKECRETKKMQKESPKHKLTLALLAFKWELALHPLEETMGNVCSMTSI